jgi:hypothetical protein
MEKVAAQAPKAEGPVTERFKTDLQTGLSGSEAARRL